mmetsp:Transcript_19225/g.45173  ORF Transcript_19225/g.45173 Transcript_19225/m.45173 type:complete len:97 (-) Transcript_19225:646-936(-)
MQDAGNFLLSVAQPSNAADKSLALLWLYRFVVLGAPGKSGMEHSMQVLMLVRTGLVMQVVGARCSLLPLDRGAFVRLCSFARHTAYGSMRSKSVRT